MSKKLKTLGIVLKLTERCNINCSYCYMFNMGDKTYKKRPACIPLEVVDELAIFLKNDCQSLGIKQLIVGLHGGEPLMQKKKDFIATCDSLINTLSPMVDIQFTIQTNAILVDKEWIDIFNQYDVCVGVSIDGTKEYNDKNRVDHRNRGTYDRVIKGIKMLQKYHKKHGTPGILCVVNPEHSAKKIYRHFVDDLELKYMDFLLPYDNHTHDLNYNSLEYGKYLCELFDEWAKDDNPRVQIRGFSSIIGMFFGGSPQIYGVGPSSPSAQLPLISISSAGDLSPTDELRATDSSINYHGMTVFNTNLESFLELPIFKTLHAASEKLPNDCQRCCWQKICGGGAIVNRYSKERQFDNPSIYCEGLKVFYSKIVNYLLTKGYDKEKLFSFLGFSIDSNHAS